MAVRAVPQTVLVCVVREETTIEGIETVTAITETAVVMTGMTGVGHIAMREMTEIEGEDIRSQSFCILLTYNGRNPPRRRSRTRSPPPRPRSPPPPARERSPQ